ncbi:MAG: hypothetical protein B6D56_02770 [Candidatus Omnitrophica bacterium 4484_70.1]|nr:MAG: hypothetical protein B6D56_02770 [Candidatus Omnitrophica bacterium 4484_70.1]
MRLFFLTFFLLAGCTPLILGTGVVAGYMLSNDSASGYVNTDYRSLWDSAYMAIKSNPHTEIIEANESKGRIKANVSGNIDLVIKINSLLERKQYLKVCARKYLLPQPHYAQKIFFKIVRDLE